MRVSIIIATIIVFIRVIHVVVVVVVVVSVSEIGVVVFGCVVTFNDVLLTIPKSWLISENLS